MIPSRIIDAQANEPAKQKIKLQPLHQLAFRPDRIKRLQKHGAQQHLRRDRGTAR
jgi:hypothetical protein